MGLWGGVINDLLMHLGAINGDRRWGENVKKGRNLDLIVGVPVYKVMKTDKTGLGR